MQEKMRALREKLGQVADIQAAGALLAWDQETYMPPKGAEARSLQLATLSALAHRLFTADETGALLEELRACADRLEPDDAALVSEAWYDYERAMRLPEAFVQKLAEEQSKAFQVWLKARQESRFPLFQPSLERLLELARQKADLIGYEGSPYNALLEEFERGVTVEQLDAVFAQLAPAQSGLVHRVAATGRRPDTRWLDQPWDEQAQWAFTIRVLKDMGFDFEAGRQDRAAHPFTTSFDIHDVRVTTRFHPRNFLTGLSSSIHEGGHALYDQGYQEKDRRTLLANAPSLGLHESQSRGWENFVGRSLPFWTHYAPVLREHFPGQTDRITPEAIYRTVNCVEPSLIRVDADECTYNLHIILRYELERGLMEREMPVHAIPEIWNAKIKEYLGVDVPDDARGCLQDVHWAHGAFGYFPSYALGNLYAAQLFETVERELPDLWNHVAEGRFGPLREWMRQRIHCHGRRKTARALIRDVTGAEPGPEPFLRYLEGKYGALYGLREHGASGEKRPNA